MAEGYVVIESILRLPLKSAGPFNTLEEKSTVTFDYISLGVYEMYIGRGGIISSGFTDHSANEVVLCWNTYLMISVLAF